MNTSTNGFSPTPIQYTSSSSLTATQVAFLRRGPSYVAPAQLHLWSAPTSSDRLKQQMAPLYDQVHRLFAHYSVDTVRQSRFQQELEQLIERCFAIPIPLKVQERSLYEQDVIETIAAQFEQHQLILRRTADNANVYYLGDRTAFQHLCKRYFRQSTTYARIEASDSIEQTIESALNQWQQEKWITKEQATKMRRLSHQPIQIPFLYFLPMVNSEEASVSVQPQLSSCQSCPIASIAHYLDQLLRPLFQQATRATIARNHLDLIQRLQQHSSPYLTYYSTTNFVSFHLEDIYQRMDHQRILHALHEFLLHPIVQSRPLPITNEAIEAMVAFVLTQQLFTYENKWYRYVRGGIKQLPLMQLLADIYIQEWQGIFVREVRLRDTFYCRYHQDGLMTWNESIDLVKNYFQFNLTLYPDLQAKVSIGTRIHFHDAIVQNRHGRLFTAVYHDPQEQMFSLPFVTDYPRIRYRQWIRSALVRAGIYCIKLDDFEREKLYIESTLLANGYSLHFVEHVIGRFLEQFPIMDPNEPITAIRYAEFRRRLAGRIAPGEVPEHNNESMIEFKYIYDWGWRCQFNRQFRRLWRSIFEQNEHSEQDPWKIRFHTQHAYLSNSLLARSS